LKAINNFLCGLILIKKNCFKKYFRILELNNNKKKMSEVFAQPHQRAQSAPNPETITKMLDENTQLVTAISEQFNKGRMQDTLE
jgi:hypothetical protein